MTLPRILQTALVGLLFGCSAPTPDLPAIDDWTGEPQVAAKIESARQTALDAPKSPEAIGRLGMVFQAHDLHSEAIECFRRAAELAPEESRWPYLAALSARRDDLESAVNWFEQAARRGANHGAFHVNFGDALARLGDSDRARTEYWRALEKSPELTHALLGLARLEMAEGEMQSAREHLEQAAGLAPWHSEVRLLLGQVYQRLERPEDAERELEAAGANPEPTQAADPILQAVEAEAVTAVAFKARARRLAEAGRFAEAESLYRKVLEIRPGTAGDYSDLGGALAGQRKLGEAIPLYRKALELDSDDPYALNNLAMALAQAGQSQEAVELLERALEIEPRYPEAHHNLGLIRAAEKDFRQAIEHYRASIQDRPSFARAYNDMGTAWAALGRFDEAVASWRRALEIDGRELASLYNLAVALARRGDHQEALEWLKRGLEIAPDSSRIASLLAWELATAPKVELRDGRRALTLARRVQAVYPGEPGMADVLAAALAETGEYEEAARVAGEAVDLAVASGRTALAEQIKQRVSAYQQKRPYRQAS